jgi:predicted transposase YdaD
MLDLQDVSLSETQFFKEVFQQGEVNLTLRLLARRCGEIAIEQTIPIGSLPIVQLENLGEALLDFTGMADLENWLKANLAE